MTGHVQLLGVTVVTGVQGHSLDSSVDVSQGVREGKEALLLLLHVSLFQVEGSIRIKTKESPV